jgi:hypothetical protein
MHEYGHTIDSRIFGISYLFAIGLPSLGSAIFDKANHSFFYTEKRANRLAARYFSKNYGINWNYLGNSIFSHYPLN